MHMCIQCAHDRLSCKHGVHWLTFDRPAAAEIVI